MGVSRSCREGHTNGTSSYSNADLTIGSGIGRGAGAFFGAAISPRIWNGRLRYVPYYTAP